MIDIGVNLTNNRFDSDRTDVIARAREAGVSAMIVTGTSLDCSRAAVELVREYERSVPNVLYCTAGIHPHEATSCNRVTLDQLDTLIRQNRDIVVAAGETGLDFNRNFSPQDTQIQAFEQQIELAIRSDLPLFLHERDACHPQRDILKSFGTHLPPAVIHCFTGDRESLESYLEMNLWIGITGWICDERRGTELQSMVSQIPDGKLMVETDAPYLLPRTLKPRPKSNRNEPAYLGDVIEMIARCRNQTAEAIDQITSYNARNFFRI